MKTPWPAHALHRDINPRYYWHTITQAINLTGTIVHDWQPNRAGMQITLHLKAPTTIDTINTATSALAVHLALQSCTATPTERSDRVTLQLNYRTTPHRLTYPHQDWHTLAAPGTPIPLGETDQGTQIRLNLYGASILIAGTPGSGKSTGQRTLLAGLAMQRNLALYGIDPKVVELKPFANRFTHLVTGNTAAPTIDLLQHLVDQVQHRAQLLAEHNQVKAEPGPDFPAIVLVVDEWAELAADGDKKQRETAAALLRRFVSLGRAVGCSVMLATQKPTTDTIDPGTRALLAYRLAYRCADKWHAESILGTGYHDPVNIQINQRGRAYLQSDNFQGMLQTYELPPEQIPHYVSPLLRIPPRPRHLLIPNQPQGTPDVIQ